MLFYIFSRHVYWCKYWCLHYSLVSYVFYASNHMLFYEKWCKMPCIFQFVVFIIILPFGIWWKVCSSSILLSAVYYSMGRDKRVKKKGSIWPMLLETLSSYCLVILCLQNFIGFCTFCEHYPLLIVKIDNKLHADLTKTVELSQFSLC